MPALSESTVQAALSTLSGWTIDAGALVRRYRLASYADGLRAVQSLGDLAQALNHHPDLRLGYSELEVRWTTHDAGGITRLDLDAAARTETTLASLWSEDPPAARNAA